MKNLELIFFPSAGLGNLLPALEFAKRLTDNGNISVTAVADESSCALFKYYVDETQIKFESLPNDGTKSWHEWVESVKPSVEKTVTQILKDKPDSKVAFIVDFYTLSILDVGQSLGIKSYLFLPRNLGFLSCMLLLGKFENQHVSTDFVISGFGNAVPAAVFPHGLLLKESDEYSVHHRLALKIKETQGIIVNSFRELESNALDALSEDENIPTIHPVGPLIDHQFLKNYSASYNDYNYDLNEWLDRQADASVIYICFGSQAVLTTAQSTELAKALMLSELSFLWCILDYEDKKQQMPEGFNKLIEEGKGIVQSWFPQAEVLCHKAIGGFLSHCGWNSIMEGLWYGVPLLTFPIFAEQPLNSFMMVKEFDLAVELKLNFTQGSIVMADEIHRGISQLMKRDSGLHRKLQEMKLEARKAVVNGGTSFISTEKLIEDMFNM